MSLVDRHVLGEWLGILGLVLGATVGLLFMQALYQDFGDLLDLKASAVDVAVYFAVRLPGYLSVVLPLSLLISLLYALGQLHRNNEIVAMRAAGLGLFRITRSLWVCSVLLCVLTWALNGSLIPWSIEESRRIFERLQFAQQAKGAEADRVGLKFSVAFDNRSANRMWFMNRYSRYTERGYGVTVVEMDPQRRETGRIVAREAWREPVTGAWTFADGRLLRMDPVSGEVASTTAFDRRTVPAFREDPALMTIFDLRPQDLSLMEISRIIAHYEREDNPKVAAYEVRYYSVLAETLGPLIILVIAVPFAVTGVRVNPAVGVSKSIGLFLLYFILVRSASALGAREILTPATAAFLPNLAMLGLGLGLFLRAR
jgi:lipopolysaccharide export system permease protein